MPPQDNQQQPNGQQPGVPAPQAPASQGFPEPTIPAVPPLHPTHVQQDFPAPETPKAEENRYAFFMEAKPKAKISLLPSKSNKFLWLIIGAVGFLLLLALTAIILSAARGSDEPAPNSVTGILNQQQEILRVTKLGQQNVQSSKLQNFNANTIITITSGQQELLTYAIKRGVEIEPKLLAKYVADPQTDKALNSALAASVYDSTYERIMLGLITEYKNSLESLSRTTANQSDKAIIDKNLHAAELLYVMLTEQS